MSRQARFTINNGTYFIFTQGNDKNKIFRTKKGYLQYLYILLYCKKQYNIKVYHYLLMDNCIYLIVKAYKKDDLHRFMKSVHIRYIKYFKKEYNWEGHLFQDRFKSFIIQEGQYLLECGRFIELKPVKMGIIDQTENYKWSSNKVYSKEVDESLIDLNPEYKKLDDNKEKRIKKYKIFVESGLNLKEQNEERFFKIGAYGSEEFVNGLIKKGLNPVGSVGRPRKSQ